MHDLARLQVTIWMKERWMLDRREQAHERGVDHAGTPTAYNHHSTRTYRCLGRLRRWSNASTNFDEHAGVRLVRTNLYKSVSQEST